MQQITNDINHFWLDLDASSSMTKYTQTVVKVVDELIRNIAVKSTELEQETRITVNTFASRGNRKVLVWDKDVLRMPSIQGLYAPYGWTAMIEGVCLSLDDMATIPTRYGNHAFVGWVITDGEENDSLDKYALKPRVAKFGDNYTLAALVPNDTGVSNAAMYGFPVGNIQKWNATSALGVENVIREVEKSASAFMETRKRTGARSTSSLFTLNTVSVSDIRNNLTPLSRNKYAMLPVTFDSRIDDFVVNAANRPYKIGSAYYQLTKTETIQPQKEVALMTNDGTVYVGDARTLLGLPDAHVKVKPDHAPGYTIFVQSTSLNRKLIAGSHCMILT